MYDEQAVGRAIQQLRKGLGMSQADLATLLTDEGIPGFYPQTIVKIEQGKRSLKFVEAVAIANVMGIDATDLLDLENLHSGDPEAMRQVRLLADSAEQVWKAYQLLEQRWLALAEYAADPDTDLSDQVRWSVNGHLKSMDPGSRIDLLLEDLASARAAWEDGAR